MGARNMVRFVKWAGFSSAALFTIGHVTESIFRLEYPEWPAYNSLNIVERPKFHQARGYFDKATVITCVIMNIIEFLSFVVILVELRKHHR